MFKALSQILKDHGATIGPNVMPQLTTTIGRLIRTQAKDDGFRMRLKPAHRAIKKLAEKGLISVTPAPPGKTMLSPFNRPLVITATAKGLALFTDLERADITAEEIEKISSLYPELTAVRPKELLNRDLRDSDLDKKETAIVRYLAATCAHNRKPWCFPAQDTIVDSCGDWYNQPMHRRTLCRKLNGLEAAGWIQRITRPGSKERLPFLPVQENGKINWKFHSTVYILCKKALAWFKKTREVANKVFNYFRVPSMSQYNIQPHRVILGGELLRAPPPPKTVKEERPKRTFLSEDDLLVRRALLKRQAASLLGQ